MSFLFDKILWLDCIGAIATGVLMIILSSWLGQLYGLPTSLVIGHGCVHLVYGCYSLSLAARKTRPMPLIKLLVFANMAWAVLCAVFAAILISFEAGFASAHFVIEGIYVAWLALIEWNRREFLASGSTKSVRYPTARET